MPVLVHKLAVELKGKSQDSVPVFVLYIKNAKALQMESMQNVSRSGERGGMTTNLLTKIKCFLLTGEVVLHPIWGALNKPSLRIVKNEIFIFNICLYWYTSITRT